MQGLAAMGPMLQLRWDLSISEVGLMLTSVSVGAAVCMFAWGLMVDRVGERAVLTGGLVAAAGATGAAALSSSFPAVVGWLIVAGIFGGCTSSATGRAVVRVFAPDQRGLALGVRQTAPILGAAAGATALPAVAAASSTSGALFVLAGAMLIGSALSVVGLRRDSPRVRSGDAGADVLSSRHLWRVNAAAMFGVTAQSTTSVYLVTFLVHEHDFELHSAATVLTVCQLLGAGARIAVGQWSDRCGSRIVPMRWLTAATTIGLLAFAGAMTGPAVAVYVLGGLVVVVAASSYGLYVTAAAEAAGADRAGTATGLLNSCMYGASAVAPLGIGAIVSSTGWQTGLAALTALSAVSWLLARHLP
ncbi:MFS transporter [Nocardia brasiliensis]|uniref:MFS transporter n=1 Tax=Nocardia brasiliensis TaxID=37326 RepID=UPI002455AB85|nr:MFS transporter [Nocardia brasiliensis]